MEDIYTYYRRQPAQLADLLAGREERLGGFVRFYNEIKPDRVYLVGSGSSQNACRGAKDFMQKMLGVEVSFFAPSAPVPLASKRPLVVAVSQEGTSTNTLSYVRGLHKVPLVAVTAKTASPLAQIAGCTVDIGVGDETIGPKTMGYTGTVMSLCLAALMVRQGAGAAVGTALADLQQAVAQMEENINRCEAFYNQYEETLSQATNYVFVGKGAAAETGLECAIKVLETVCVPASGYEFEEYLHGPACCIGEGTALFLFLPGDADEARVMQLADIARGATPNCYIVARGNDPQADKTLALAGPAGPDVAPFSDVLIGQLIAARMTEFLQRERHPAVHDIFTAMKTKAKEEEA